MSHGCITISMETPKYREVKATVKDIGELVVGWAKDIICPPSAVDLPQRGAAEMLDQQLYEQPEIPGGDWDSLRGI